MALQNGGASCALQATVLCISWIWKKSTLTCSYKYHKHLRSSPVFSIAVASKLFHNLFSLRAEKFLTCLAISKR